MIVKEGREYIVRNGLEHSLKDIKVYFDNDPNITTEDRALTDSSTKYMYILPKDKDEKSYIEVLETDNKISKKECSTVLINNSNLIPKDAVLERGFSINYDTALPLDIKFTINGVKIENLEPKTTNSDSVSISSLMLVIEEKEKKDNNEEVVTNTLLLSRVVFPTRTLKGNTTALNFEYHLYF